MTRIIFTLLLFCSFNSYAAHTSATASAEVISSDPVVVSVSVEPPALLTATSTTATASLIVNYN